MLQTPVVTCFCVLYSCVAHLKSPQVLGRPPELENNVRRARWHCWLPGSLQPEGLSRTQEVCVAQLTSKLRSLLILSPFLPELRGVGEEMVTWLAGWGSHGVSEAAPDLYSPLPLW